MMDAPMEIVRQLLGLGRDIADVNALQMALRTILIYAFSVAAVIAAQGAGVSQIVENPDGSWESLTRRALAP